MTSQARSFRESVVILEAHTRMGNWDIDMLKKHVKILQKSIKSMTELSETKYSLAFADWSQVISGPTLDLYRTHQNDPTATSAELLTDLAFAFSFQLPFLAFMNISTQKMGGKKISSQYNIYLSTHLGVGARIEEEPFIDMVYSDLLRWVNASKQDASDISVVLPLYSHDFFSKVEEMLLGEEIHSKFSASWGLAVKKEEEGLFLCYIRHRNFAGNPKLATRTEYSDIPFQGLSK